jgi:hypothetical protein
MPTPGLVAQELCTLYQPGIAWYCVSLVTFCSLARRTIVPIQCKLASPLMNNSVALLAGRSSSN